MVVIIVMSAGQTTSRGNSY